MLEDKVYYRLKDIHIPNHYFSMGYNTNSKIVIKKLIYSYLLNCTTFMEGDFIPHNINLLSLDHLLEYIGAEVEESNFPFNLL